jgi:hypothetical protein
MATAGTHGTFHPTTPGVGGQGRHTQLRSDRIDESNAICRISLASPEQILKWSSRQRRQAEHLSNLQLSRLGEEIDPTSFGEVKKPETINYRTFKPEMTVSSASASSALSRTGNAPAANINASNTRALSATVAASR